MGEGRKQPPAPAMTFARIGVLGSRAAIQKGHHVAF